MNGEEKAIENARQGDEALCSSCVYPNAPEANFCKKCGAPMSSFALICPYQSIMAEGFLYRQTVIGHPRKIVLIGMWIICLPGVIAGFVCLFSIWRQPSNIMATVPLALFSILFTGLLYRVTANYFRKRDPTSKEEIQPGVTPLTTRTDVGDCD